MAKFRNTKGSGGGDDSVSDSVSELGFTDDFSDTGSKSSAFRSKFFRGKQKWSTDARSLGSLSPNRKIPPLKAMTDARSVGSTATTITKKTTDTEKLARNAKSRYNVALIYIKTGDYAKAQDNLENSLYCYLQLYGHDGNCYTNDTLFAIAGVREKLGECYLADSDIGNKSLALDHYEESRRLLGSVAPEDAPEKINEMTTRVDARIAELSQKYQSIKYLKTQAKRNMQKYLQPENNEDLISGVEGDVSVGMTKHRHISQIKANPINALKTKHMVDSFTGCLVTDECHDLLNQILSKLLRNVKIEDRTYQGAVYPSCFVGSEAVSYMVESKSALSRSDAKKVLRDLLSEGYFIDVMLGTQEFKDEFVFYHFTESVVLKQFETVMNHLGRGNHSTAADILRGLREGGGNPMKNTDFRAEWTSCMIQVAGSALQDNKVSLATNTFEAVYDVVKDHADAGSAMKLAVKGCIKGHKLTAIELESIKDYSSAIEHRERAYKLLLTEDRTVGACQQLLKIARLHGEQDNYSRGAVTLADAIRRLLSGNKSVDAYALARERAQLLGQCYKMRAVCFSKIGKWVEASEQYGELVTFLKKTLGTDSPEFNSALIQKAALSVTLKKFQLAHEEISNYFDFAKHVQKADHLLIVDDLDHALALDTSAAIYLKLGNTDKVIHIFESKLAFLKTLSDSDEMRSDIMYKLGCLLAYKGQPNAALPLLNEALDIMRRLYGNTEASVLQTTWAVAVTSQMLGDKSRSTMEYSVILDSKGDLDKIFSCHVSPVLIHNSAGKLFAEMGEAEKAVHCFREALLKADLPAIKTEISLNLANALSAKGDLTKAMNYYDRILKGKKSELVFLALYNKSLLLIKMGEVVEAKAILQDIANTASSLADGVRFGMYLTLGNVAISENKQNDALIFFKNALDVCKDGAVESVVQTNRHIGMTYLAMGQLDNALASFESALSTLSVQEGKSIDMLKADVWNSMTQVYKEMGDLHKAQNYARLSLQTCKSELGETHPRTLRNVSNLQLLLFEEAETGDLPPNESKTIIDVAKYELEDTLECFQELDDPWTHRVDIATLKTNLAFVALWQGKPKKARKLLHQIKEIEIPLDHSLIQQVALLEERVNGMTKSRR